MHDERYFNFRGIVYLTLFAFILFVLVFPLLSDLQFSKQAANKPLTVIRLKNIYLAMEIVRAERPEGLLPLLVNTNTGSDARLKQFYRREAEILWTEKWDEATLDKMVVDGWGRAFNILSRSQLADQKVGGDLLQNSGEILVWSSGRDGTNHFGRGDDVTVKLR